MVISFSLYYWPFFSLTHICQGSVAENNILLTGVSRKETLSVWKIAYRIRMVGKTEETDETELSQTASQGTSGHSESLL